MNASTTTSGANWFLSATTVPPIPQSTQSEAEVIDWMKIFRLGGARELLLQGNLMTKYQQSYFNITQSLKGQQKLPPSLIFMYNI